MKILLTIRILAFLCFIIIALVLFYSAYITVGFSSVSMGSSVAEQEAGQQLGGYENLGAIIAIVISFLLLYAQTFKKTIFTIIAAGAILVGVYFAVTFRGNMFDDLIFPVVICLILCIPGYYLYVKTEKSINPKAKWI